MTQPKPPILTIQMVPAGVELVLGALNQLPRAQVDGLFQEIASQYAFQMQQLQADVPELVEETVVLTD